MQYSYHSDQQSHALAHNTASALVTFPVPSLWQLQLQLKIIILHFRFVGKRQPVKNAAIKLKYVVSLL